MLKFRQMMTQRASASFISLTNSPYLHQRFMVGEKSLYHGFSLWFVGCRSHSFNSSREKRQLPPNFRPGNLPSWASLYMVDSASFRYLETSDIVITASGSTCDTPISLPSRDSLRRLNVMPRTYGDVQQLNNLGTLNAVLTFFKR